ncbi:hypothetical protein [Salinimicrobium oceani]|uniref:Uncharacterized protein n=1 Tax=Salinimicrobium oceani TaxID=2722702 RepID=A0ABX1CZY8_9FLAO|nr:hypothetical protein [Salinimicrobium oceani]NJW53830.1 hypothetical protein [Salinimicrobium oceani]
MEREVRYLILLAALLGNFHLAIAQELSTPPPEPMMTTEGPSRTGCGEGGTSPPPPVGLCLPINDYLLPLFASGVLLGGISLLKLNRKEAPKSSVL